MLCGGKTEERTKVEGESMKVENGGRDVRQKRGEKKRYVYNIHVVWRSHVRLKEKMIDKMWVEKGDRRLKTIEPVVMSPMDPLSSLS